MTHGDGGKGDTQRPTDHNKYSSNFDRIFRSGKHYKDGSLEKQVLDDVIAGYDKALGEALIKGEPCQKESPSV
jgi:hypothetical protein